MDEKQFEILIKKLDKMIELLDYAGRKLRKMEFKAVDASNVTYDD